LSMRYDGLREGSAFVRRFNKLYPSQLRPNAPYLASGCFRFASASSKDTDMAVARKALTKLLIEKTPLDRERARDIFLWDSRVPGFGVRIYPTGKRMYVFQYRTISRQQRRIAIGLHGPFTVERARESAADLYEAVRKGRDPVQEQKTAARRTPDNIEAVTEDFVQRYLVGKGRAKSYIEDARAIFANHVLPRWRGRDIKTITRRDVIELLDAISDAGKPIAANRTLAAVRKLFNWALQRGIIDASPGALVEMPGAERKRERTLAADEIRAVWTAAGELGYPFGEFFRIALVTGQRREEVAQMRTADIDEDDRIWTLSSDITKAGRSHVVPLSTLALEVLGETKEAARNLRAKPEDAEPATYVFTTRGDRPISGYSKAKARLDRMVGLARAEAGLPDLEPWTIHDLRRTVGTGLGKLGAPRFIIARVLNHADRTVTGIYDRYEYLDEKRRALDAWGQYLENLIVPPGSNVVPIRTTLR
jgi:integrase